MHENKRQPMTVAALVPKLYDDLHSMAQRMVAGERCGHTLQATALVHELYLRLEKSGQLKAASKEQFFALAATAMRNILVNHARDRARLKRGGDKRRTQLDDVVAAFEHRALDLLALDEALDALSAIDSRQRQLVELRFFAGLSNEETAEVLGVSTRTVERNWNAVRLWLLREMRGERPSKTPARKSM